MDNYMIFMTYVFLSNCSYRYKFCVLNLMKLILSNKKTVKRQFFYCYLAILFTFIYSSTKLVSNGGGFLNIADLKFITVQTFMIPLSDFI